MYEYEIDRNVDGHPIVFDGASLDKKTLVNHLNELSEALAFYGDPETYHAIAFLPDPPCGEFMEDFGDNDDYDYPKPGKLARDTYKSLYSEIVNR